MTPDVDVTKFNTKNGSTFVDALAHTLLNHYYYYYWDFFRTTLHEFNNFCNILSPEEFNRRAVSFEALYASYERHAAHGYRALAHHTHIHT